MEGAYNKVSFRSAAGAPAYAVAATEALDRKRFAAHGDSSSGVLRRRQSTVCCRVASRRTAHTGLGRFESRQVLDARTRTPDPLYGAFMENLMKTVRRGLERGARDTPAHPLALRRDPRAQLPGLNARPRLFPRHPRPQGGDRELQREGIQAAHPRGGAEAPQAGQRPADGGVLPAGAEPPACCCCARAPTGGRALRGRASLPACTSAAGVERRGRGDPLQDGGVGGADEQGHPGDAAHQPDARVRPRARAHRVEREGWG